MVARKLYLVCAGIAGLVMAMGPGYAGGGELFPQISPRQLLPPPAITSPPAIHVPEPIQPASPQVVVIPRILDRSGSLETLQTDGEQVILRDGQVVYRSSAVKGVLVTPGQVLLFVEPRQ